MRVMPEPELQWTRPPHAGGSAADGQTPLTTEQREAMLRQAQHNDEIARHTREMMHKTLRNATRSYLWVTTMNVAMFAVGLALFVTAAAYGLFVERDSVYPIVFSGLGATTFVALFLTGAIAKTQNALSNLVQVEIAFMQWFSQMALWTTYPGLPADGHEQVAARVREASETMQRRSAETVKLLQGYAESAEGD